MSNFIVDQQDWFGPPHYQDFIGALYINLADALPDDWTIQFVEIAVRRALTSSKTELHDKDPQVRKEGCQAATELSLPAELRPPEFSVLDEHVATWKAKDAAKASKD